MNTYLDEKEEHKQEYNDKIKAISTGKTKKIRVTKKKIVGIFPTEKNFVYSNKKNLGNSNEIAIIY